MSPAFTRSYMPGHRATITPNVTYRRPPVQHAAPPANSPLPDAQSPALGVGAGGKVSG